MRKPLIIVLASGFVVLSVGVIGPRDLAGLVLRQTRQGPRCPDRAPSLTPPAVTADRRELLALLRRRDFATLHQRLVDFQHRFEEDVLAETDLDVALSTFDTTDPTLAPVLDAWVAQQPRAWTAHLARARYLVAVAWARRETAGASESTAAPLAGMPDAVERADRDADTVLELAPKVVEAYAIRMMRAMADGSPRTCRRLADAALAVAPASFRIRSTYLACELPRWGGRYATMESFADASQAFAHTNPQLTALRGFVEWDEGRRLLDDGHYEEALRSFTRALSCGEYASFYESRAVAYQHLDRHDEALADVRRACALGSARACGTPPHER
ncbi:MAG: DUF4034 domain-containing protein [Candidatus Binatia bacterium]